MYGGHFFCRMANLSDLGIIDAGVNYRREQGWTDEDIMEMANMSARTYVTHYMRKIRRARLSDTDGG